MLLAAGLRFHLLGAQSLWNDEGNSYVQSTRALTEIAEHAGRDIHPPGYYWLLAVWRGVAGESEFALRALSAFASVISVALTFALGKRLYSPWAGAVAALIVAMNSFSIYYAQETRMYALLALWSVAAMWALVGLAHRPNWRWVLALALLNAAGLWTQYGFAFVMLAQGVLAVVWMAGKFEPQRRKGAEENQEEIVGTRFIASEDSGRGVLRFLTLYVAANLLAIALYAPWLPVAIPQITTWPNTGEGTPFAEALGETLNWLVFGRTYAYTTPGSLAIANFLLLFGLVPLYGRKHAGWSLLVAVAWAAIPLGIFLALDLFRISNIKLILPAQIAVALWLGRGLWVLWHYAERRFEPQRRKGAEENQEKVEPPRHQVHGENIVGTRFITSVGGEPQGRFARWLFPVAAVAGAAWMVFNLAAGIAPLYSEPAYQRDNYRAIVGVIHDSLREGDAVILDAPNQEEVFRYYYRGDAPVYPLPPGLGGNDDETRAAVQAIIDQHERAFVVFWGETERDPQRIVETTLDTQTFEVSDQWYGDVRLSRYVMPVEFTDVLESGARFGEHITLESYALSAESLAQGDVLQVQLNWRTDERLAERYKVFIQLLDENGVLAAQRDSEPGGGLSLTTDWTPGEVITDRHGLLIPETLRNAHYTLIIGLYPTNDAAARLRVNDGDHLLLGTIAVGEQ